MELGIRHLFRGLSGVRIGDLWTAAGCISLLWLIFRVFLVYRKPREELEEILGIDIPPAPEVTLSSIASDSVVLFWKTPENYYSPLSLSVQVNGIDANFIRSDATVKVPRLQPGRCYGIRVVTTNGAGNPSYSSVIQVQIPPDGGHCSSKLLSSFDNAQAKRSGSRRISHPLSGGEKSGSLSGHSRSLVDHHDDSQKKLQRTLDNLRRDVEEAEVQLTEDRDEAEGQTDTLISQRDALKRQMEDREKESAELRKRVQELEKSCRSSQRKKSDRERKVREKRDERQRMKDNMLRWDAECVKIREDLENTEQSKTEIRESHELKLQEAQERVDAVNYEVSRLEEELREMGIKVKKLEEEREKVDRQQNDEEKLAEQRERDESEAHEAKVRELQYDYQALWKVNAIANARLADVKDQVQQYFELRNREPGSFYPIPGLDYQANAFQSMRRPRAQMLSMNRPNHPTYSPPANPSPTFANALPFPPLGAALRSGSYPLSPTEVEQLTAGAPMSPSADILLPSDLLGDEDETSGARRRASQRSRGGSIPHIYRPPSRDAGAKSHDPQSPQSIDSKSPSLLGSPHESRTHIANVYGHDVGEDDTQSLGSNSSPFAAAAPVDNPSSSRKIGSILWGFNRQRDKALLNELPAMGSLKPNETQSFPSNLDGGPETPPPGRRVGGIWSPMTGPFNFLSRGSTKNPENEFLASGPMRKGRRGILGSKINQPDQLMSSSSRPSSTYSHDHLVGQHVIEGQFGWATPDSARPRGATMGPWSHSQSRRTSIQHGSTSNLSLGSTPLDPADDYSSPYVIGAKSTPAPIGTERFRIGQRSNTPRLNPTAPSFTTRLFSRGAKTEKTLDASAEKGKGKDGDDKARDLDAYSKSSSPPVSRLSHEAPSITTSASLGESHDSLEPSTSHSEAAAPTGGSAPKESLMQRITRKSSSSKFSVPWSKDRSGKGGSSRKEPSTPGDLEEDPDSDYLGKGSTSEVTTSTPERGVGRGSLSWSRVMGKGRKRSELNMSDAGERSSEAGGETTEDDG